MNENSPICDRLIPQLTEVLSDSPDRKAPRKVNTGLPMSTTSVMATIAPTFSTIDEGDKSMPTDTKKMAPKKSFKGLKSLSMRWPCTVPARTEPARNAPSAEEKPMEFASATMHRHSATDVISMISSVRAAATRASSDGTITMLSANHTSR